MHKVKARLPETMEEWDYFFQRVDVMAIYKLKFGCLEKDMSKWGDAAVYNMRRGIWGL